MSDLVPTAGTSATVDEEEEEEPAKAENAIETVPEIVCDPSTISIANAAATSASGSSSNSSSYNRNKRRSQDEAVHTPSSKKPRRMSKMRGKRMKI